MYMDRHKLLQLFADQETYDRVFPIIRKAVSKTEWPFIIFVWLGPTSAPISLAKNFRVPKALLSITSGSSANHLKKSLQRHNICIDCAFLHISHHAGVAMYFEAGEMCETALKKEDAERR